MNNKAQLELMSKQAVKDIQKFNLDNIISEWLNLFNNMKRRACRFMENRVDRFIQQVMKRAVFRQTYIMPLFKLINLIINSYKIEEGKKRDNYIYLTICNIKGFDMVINSIMSLERNSHLLPKKYIIVSDGSWKPEMGSEILKKYKLPLLFVSWEESTKKMAIMSQ